MLLEVYFYLDRVPGQPIDPKLKEFLRFVLSRQGQAAIAKDGKYLPLTKEAVEEQLKKLVSVRTKEKTYNLADAEVESVIEERTVRRQNRKQNQPAVVSRAQEERMRLILSLQGTTLPDDITLFSRRGPITTSEQHVALESKNPG